jgi:hypothetical protein
MIRLFSSWLLFWLDLAAFFLYGRAALADYWENRVIPRALALSVKFPVHFLRFQLAISAIILFLIFLRRRERLEEDNRGINLTFLLRLYKK